MKGLLLRLSGLDADAENAVRVIGFFDRLITAHADLDTLVRSTADLAGCPVGVHAPGRGLSLRAAPGGDVGAPGTAPPGAAARELEGGVVVWVARAGAPVPLDDMLLERFAIATAILLEHPGVPRPELGDPALVELALTEDAGTAERSRALHLLGFGPAARLRVLATAGGEVPARRSAVLGTVRAVLTADTDPIPDAGAGRSAVPGNGPAAPATAPGPHPDGTRHPAAVPGTGRATPVPPAAGGRAGTQRATPTPPAADGRAGTGRATAAAPAADGQAGTQRATPTPPAADGRAGAGRTTAPGAVPALPGYRRVGVGPVVPAIEVARSWAAARTALRFTADDDPVVHWEHLGSLAALDGTLSPAGLPDVRALDRLAAEPHGEDTLAALSALCATGSARKAAAVLHRHHSTMPARLARAEAVLGFDVDSPAGRFRLHLALMLRRLRDNAGLS
ncbi:helix-turn-helix domain-containing protein [Amycolatopsis sp. cg9]|uniref:helix-turn-helix domain-containing protein n=1 Tax=Amycolatopsis sp. cg9 TaxID=3238801 RepID=UPI003524E47C